MLLEKRENQMVDSVHLRLRCPEVGLRAHCLSVGRDSQIWLRAGGGLIFLAFDGVKGSLEYGARVLFVHSLVMTSLAC